MSDQLRDIVGRMVAAGESEEDIAAVIRQLSTAPPMDPIEPAVSHGPQPKSRREQMFEEMPYLKKVEEGILGGGVFSAAPIAGKAALGLGQKLAQRVYTGLLKPKQAVKDSFGGSRAIAETALAERAPITQGGLLKVQSRLGQSRQAALDTVSQAEQQGVQGVTARQIISEFKPVIEELRKRVDVGQANELGRVGARGRAILTHGTRWQPGTPGTPAVPPIRITTPASPDSVDAAIRANLELGSMARNIPTSVFGGVPAEVEAARQLGPLAAVVPRRLLGGGQNVARVTEFGGRPAVAAVPKREIGIPLTRAQQLKETAQDAASGAYRTIERGTQKQLSADDLLDAAVAKGLRTGIETRVPAVAAHNQRSQSLIGVQRALEDALERESNTLGVGGAKDMLAMMTGGGAFAAGAGPASIPIAVGTRLLTTPSTGSMGAILLNEASRSGILDGATRAAMIAMMRGRE